jgi:8-oxo-dGTP pyrophosphatase MutT (NUDIX family)
MNNLLSAQEFPHLLQEGTWGAIQHRFEICLSSPPAELVGNVSLVPFVGECVLVIRLQDGQWEIPGGTLEPGESYLDAIRRELMEEAGARLLTVEWFGAWHCHSPAPEPYRLHLPHPEFYRVVGWGQVEIVSAPQNPQGGEQVAQVECVTVQEAARRFVDIERPDLADLYRLADAIRSSGL